MAIDRFDWHYDSAEKAYRERNNITGEFTDEQSDEVCLYAADHIGLFLRWIIENGFEGEDSDPEGCERVRKGELSGADYLLAYCDGKFWDCDICDDIKPFVAEYYESDKNLYFHDLGALPGYKVYETISGDAEYNAIKPYIDKAYEEFKNR